MRYRLVSDYGFGDKAWLERDLTAAGAIEELNQRVGYQAVSTIEQALWFDHPIYRIEEDDPDDTEDKERIKCSKFL